MDLGHSTTTIIYLFGQRSITYIAQQFSLWQWLKHKMKISISKNDKSCTTTEREPTRTYQWTWSLGRQTFLVEYDDKVSRHRDSLSFNDHNSVNHANATNPKSGARKLHAKKQGLGYQLVPDHPNS